MEYAAFDLDNLSDLKQMLDENCQKYEGPMGDLTASPRAEESAQKQRKKTTRGGKRRDQNFVVRDMITCLALCHNVTPTYPDPSDMSIRDFQASSPDEVALVKFADSLGI